MSLKSIIKYVKIMIRGAAQSICSLRCKTSKEIPAAFHNGSTYDYHFLIKELTRKTKGQLECLGENAEKCITFIVPIKKELVMVNQLHTN